MSDEQLYRLYAKKRLNDRQLDELIGLAHGIIADDEVNSKEVKYLQKWLAANLDVVDNAIAAKLYNQVTAMLSDNKLSADEVVELFNTLQSLVGEEFELGEVQKSCTLPLDDPPPRIVFLGRRFCFTGSFAEMSRDECEKAVECRGAKAGSLTKNTDYLVVAKYATGSWKHSSFGDKIERAVSMKSDGHPIAIVGEAHWKEALNSFPPVPGISGS